MRHSDKDIKGQSTAHTNAKGREDCDEPDPVAGLDRFINDPDCQRGGSNREVPNEARRSGVHMPCIHHRHDVPRVGLKPRDEVIHRMDRAPNGEASKNPAHLQAQADAERAVRRTHVCRCVHAVCANAHTDVTGRAKRWIIRTAGGPKNKGADRTQSDHHDNTSFQRVIWARTLSGAVPP